MVWLIFIRTTCAPGVTKNLFKYSSNVCMHEFFNVCIQKFSMYGTMDLSSFILGYTKFVIRVNFLALYIATV